MAERTWATIARARAEARLRESDARFRAMTDCIDPMVWSTLPDGYHDFYNQRWYDFTGVPLNSTDGQAWNGIFHPEDQDRAWAVWRHSLATGKPYHIEYRLRHCSGRYRWVLGRAQPVRDKTGAITRWYGTCTDIQEIVEARDVLARSRQELEQLVLQRTAERDRAWNLSQDLQAVAEMDGILAAVNAPWTSLLGWSESELIGSNFAVFTHPDDLEATLEVFCRHNRGAFDDPL